MEKNQKPLQEQVDNKGNTQQIINQVVDKGHTGASEDETHAIGDAENDSNVREMYVDDQGLGAVGGKETELQYHCKAGLTTEILPKERDVGNKVRVKVTLVKWARVSRRPQSALNPGNKSNPNPQIEKPKNLLECRFNKEAFKSEHCKNNDETLNCQYPDCSQRCSNILNITMCETETGNSVNVKSVDENQEEEESQVEQEPIGMMNAVGIKEWRSKSNKQERALDKVDVTNSSSCEVEIIPETDLEDEDEESVEYLKKEDKQKI